MRSADVTQRLARDFPQPIDHDAAADLLGSIERELSTWEIVRVTDRVELAALAIANGDLEFLKDAVELALADWRDLLVAVGDA